MRPGKARASPSMNGHDSILLKANSTRARRTWKLTSCPYSAIRETIPWFTIKISRLGSFDTTLKSAIDLKSLPDKFNLVSDGGRENVTEYKVKSEYWLKLRSRELNLGKHVVICSTYNQLGELSEDELFDLLVVWSGEFLPS